MGSPLWKKIKSLAFFLKLGSKWMIGNGTKAMLWHDIWLGNEPIADLFPSLQFSSSTMVSEMIVSSGWHIPADIHPASDCFQFLDNAALPPIGGGEDSLIWSASPKGSFSKASAWDLIWDSGDLVPWGHLVWSNLINPSVAAFAWRFFHLKTPTDLWAQGIGVSLASSCPICGIAAESTPHLFFFCSHAVSFWNLICSKLGLVVSTNLGELWESLTDHCNSSGIRLMGMIIINGLHQLWSDRNMAKFNSKMATPPRSFSKWRQASLLDASQIAKLKPNGPLIPPLLHLLQISLGP